MGSFTKTILIFLAVVGAITLGSTFFSIEFTHQEYWKNHGVWFLIFITLFPRLTLLFSSVPFGGIFWWLGFFFAPRILIAFLATINYVHENPILVAISWFVALSGESGEKYVITQKGPMSSKFKFSYQTSGRAGTGSYSNFEEFSSSEGPRNSIEDKDTIEAEFKRKDD